ncbi:hypothetical protein AeRB84_009342 [Aphanomyces euteiches]|nr:hypothetical protein AeRB84_009342 [Aphanomyces euteiches]
MFDIKGLSFERLIIKFIDVVETVSHEKNVLEVAKKYNMRVTSGRVFRHFPSARYAVDVTFQQSYKPSGTMPEIKAFYSKKHALYGFKVEVSVHPNGLTIDCSDHARGATANIQIFRVNIDFHRREIKKMADDGNWLDEGPYLNEFGDEWCILADKGYQGLLQHVPAVTPKKPSPNKDYHFKTNNQTIALPAISLLWKTFLVVCAAFEEFALTSSVGVSSSMTASFVSVLP